MKKLIFISLLLFAGCKSYSTNPEDIFNLNATWQSFIFDKTFNFLPARLELQKIGDKTDGVVDGTIEIDKPIGNQLYSTTKYNIAKGLLNNQNNATYSDVYYDIVIYAESTSYPGGAVQFNGNVKKINDEWVLVMHVKFFTNGYEDANTYDLHFRKQTNTRLPKSTHTQGNIYNGY